VQNTVEKTERTKFNLDIFLFRKESLGRM